MRIKSVSASGFKGRDFNVELAPVTVLAGANFRGKTAVLQALELACTRKVAGIGARPGDLFERLASGQELVAKAETDNGVTYQCSLQKVSTKIVAGGVVQDGQWALPSILFDPSEFLELSGKEKVKHLFRVLPPPDLSKVGPAAIVANLKNWKGEPHTEAHEKAINGLCDYVREYWEGANKEWQVQELLDMLAEKVRLKANESVAAAKRMKATILGVAQLKAPDQASLSVAEAAVGKARAALENAQAELTVARTNYTAKQKQVAEAKALAESWHQPEPGVREALEAKVAELRPVALAGILSPTLTEKPSLDDVTTALNMANESLRDAFTAKRTADAEVDRLEKLLAEAKHATTCPTCGQDTTEITKKVLAGHRAALKVATAARSAADGLHTSKVVVQAIAKGNFDQVATEAERLHKADREHLSNYRLLCTKRDEAGDLLRVTEGQLQSLKDAEAKAEPARLAREALPMLEAELFAIKDVGAGLAQNVELLKANVSEADVAHRRVVAEAGEAVTQAKAALAADQAQAEAEATKALASFLQDLLELCVEQSVKPFVEGCNALYGGILTAPLAFQDGDLGMVRGGRFISWRSFSGTEKALSMMALCVGLATTSPVRLAILDEVTRLDFVRKKQLSNVLNDLVDAGKLDQAIIVDTDVAYWRNITNEANNSRFALVEIK